MSYAPPLAELRETIAAASASDPVPLICASAFEGRTPPPRDWLVRAWFPAGTVSLLGGDGGVGKSALALQLAVACASGTPWMGQTVKAGRVLYLSAEDDHHELHRRIRSICNSAGVCESSLGDLFLWPLADQDAVLFSADGRVLSPTHRWTELRQHVVETQPAAIFIDSLADVFGGNENARPEVRYFVGQLRRLAIESGAAVVILAHPSLDGLKSGSGMSGSTAWNNSVRSRVYLDRPARIGGGADIDPDARVLRLMKANYAAPQSEMRLRWFGGGFVLEEGGKVRISGEAQARQDDALFLHLLDSYAAQGRQVSAKPGSTFAPTTFAEDAAATGRPKAALLAAMNRLLHAGAIRSEMHGPPSRQRHRLVRVA